MEATCCQDEEPVFLRCGHQICVWVSKSHRCAGAGATPWWLRFLPLRRGSLQKKSLIFVLFFIGYFWNWLLLSQELRNEGMKEVMKEWRNESIARACYHTNCARYRSNWCHSNCAIIGIAITSTISELLTRRSCAARGSCQSNPATNTSHKWRYLSAENRNKHRLQMHEHSKNAF